MQEKTGLIPTQQTVIMEQDFDAIMGHKHKKEDRIPRIHGRELAADLSHCELYFLNAFRTPLLIGELLNRL